MAVKIQSETWIIVPAYNEASYISTVLKKIRTQTDNVIVVDDGSRDETLKKAKKLAKYTLHHPLNLGKGAAMRTGCDFAFSTLKAKAVIFMDADDQHDSRELPLFFKALAKYQVILGVRQVKTTMPAFRSLGNRVASRMVWLFFGTYIPDIPSGYKAFTRHIYPQLRWKSNGYAVEMEIAARIAKQRLPFSTICIATIYHDMNKGMTFLDIADLAWNIFNWKFSL